MLPLAAALFPTLPEQQPWKLVNLNTAFLDEEQKLDMRKIEDQETLIWNVSEKDTYYTYGGFGEDRTDIWEGFEKDARKMVHLGVDFNVPEWTTIAAVASGKVIHVMKDETPFNGWGGRVLIQDKDYVFLYGHLFQNSLPCVGDAIAKDEVLGFVGPNYGNGGWFPHLHFQVMTHAYVERYKDDLSKIDGYDFEGNLDGIIDPFEWFLKTQNAALIPE